MPSVLLLGFNRPDRIKQTILAISAAAPERLYVACDGARSNRKGEAHAVASVRHRCYRPAGIAPCRADSWKVTAAVWKQ
jgi:hypothetical protein